MDAVTQAAVIVDELIRGGIEHVVVCPGSRNSPLTFAVAARPELTAHVRIDERSAGFLALGLALSGDGVSRAPVAIMMTSGTAVANLAPAVFEANYARVPLLVISANRPYDLLGSGANQTIEQANMFGTQVRGTFSLGLANGARSGPSDHAAAGANARWRSVTCRAIAAARGSRSGNPGPIHFDLPFAEPLVPQRVAEPLPLEFSGRPGAGPWTVSAAGTLAVPLPIDLTEDTVVIAGHGAGLHPELAGLPTIAEPTVALAPGAVLLHPWALGGTRSSSDGDDGGDDGGAGDGPNPAELRPTQAIICGRPTLHREVTAVLADPAVAVYALTTGPRWPDVSGNVQATGTHAITLGEPRPEWLAAAAAADARVRSAIEAGLAENGLAGNGLAGNGSAGNGKTGNGSDTGLGVAAALAAALRPGDTLVVGASNPIRDLAIAAPQLVEQGRPGPGGVRVLSNRGVAGIDGTVSTAIGAAIAAPGRTIALLGDLTFLHDIGGLLLGPGEPRPADLTIVVANDNGGGIFSLLEPGDPRLAAANTERFFGTPHAADLGALCAGYGIDHIRCTAAELGDRIAEAPGRDSLARSGSIRVIEVPTDRRGLRDLHAELRARAGRP